jgi:6-phosphogluconolactonase (cycloisomerase 2 family)
VTNKVTYHPVSGSFRHPYLVTSVSTYVVDAAAGRLKYIGKVAAGTSPFSVAVDPSGRYAYVANLNSANVSQYTIGANGALTPMATATVAAEASPRSVTAVGSWQ